jgi:hypothetical protein
MAIRPQPTQPNRLTQTQSEFSINSSNIVGWMGDFADELNAVSSTYLLGVTGTSTTSNSIGTGAKTFTTQTGLGFVVGNTIRLAFDSTNYMTGDVTSYNSGTGSLVVNVTAVVGSGTRTSWTISLAAVGANNASSVSFTPAGNVSATNVQAAIQELDTEKLSSAAGAVTGTNLESITTSETVGSAYVIPVITKDVKGRVTGISTAQKITSGTAIATTSGTSHDFTSIPAGVKKITLMFSAVSTNGTSIPLVQLGDSGGIETSGYSSVSIVLTGSGSATTSSAGFAIFSNAAAAIIYGSVVLTLLDSATNLWTISGTLTRGDASALIMTAGSKALSATLDRIRLTTTNGTDTFDAGSINILME